MRDFAIDGTGRVIRPGDKVIVRAGLFSDSLTGHVEVIADEYFIQVHGQNVMTESVRRADDDERVDGGPLWVE